MPAQPPPDRSRLLRAQIQREVLLLGVEETELLALVRVDDCEDAGDGFTEVGAVFLRIGISFLGGFEGGTGTRGIRDGFFRTFCAASRKRRRLSFVCGADRALF